MHEAKSRLSELVKAVEERSEIVIICRDGRPVAEMKARTPSLADALTPDPTLKATFAPGYNPTEPATEDDWPKECR